MNKVALNIISLSLSATVLFASCTKDAIVEQALPAKDLEVQLNSAYMPAGKIDSAVAIWETNGNRQTVKLQIDGNKATTSLANFRNNGAGTLFVQLYTQTKYDNIPLQWEKRVTYTLNTKEPLQLAAPQNLTDPAWNPRLIYNSEIYMATFTAIIALRPADAYFELKGVGAPIAKRIEVVRSFYLEDGTTMVASRGWIGEASHLDSKGGFEDRVHFGNLEELLAGKEWHKFKIKATFYANTDPVQVYQAATIHNKP